MKISKYIFFDFYTNEYYLHISKGAIKKDEYEKELNYRVPLDRNIFWNVRLVSRAYFGQD